MPRVERLGASHAATAERDDLVQGYVSLVNASIAHSTDPAD